MDATFHPVLPLIEEVIPFSKSEKTKYISMDLKLKAGGGAKEPTYEKHLRVFDGGTPQAYITLRQDIQEIFRQNKVENPNDQCSIIFAALKSESRAIFEVALEEARRNEDAEELDLAPLTEEHVSKALSALAASVFPHRALEMQKEWMQRSMKKPFNLSAQRTAAAISQLNNALPWFPGATPKDKFPEEKLVSLLEFSLLSNAIQITLVDCGMRGN